LKSKSKNEKNRENSHTHSVGRNFCGTPKRKEQRKLLLLVAWLVGGGTPWVVGQQREKASF
jgi:hypothetical protein